MANRSRRQVLSAVLGVVMSVALLAAGALAQFRGPSDSSPRVAAADNGPFRLSKEHQAYLDKVLAYWEWNSAKIKTYRCKFIRWEYDAVFGPQQGADGKIPAKTISTGVIKYAKPDKGMFEIEKAYDYAPPKEPGGKPQYTPRQTDGFEKWMCDGEAIYEFDFLQKQIVEYPLPPERRGKAITDGPLPFLFGAEAATIKQRYWLRVVTPPETKGEYWLEAWPRNAADAGNFKKVEIIISEEDFLPKAMKLFDVNYDPVRNPSSTAFAFEERKINEQDLMKVLNIFHREFRPSRPSGWKWMRSNLGEAAPANQPPPQEPGAVETPPRQAIRGTDAFPRNR